jgi:hypothetical protein
LEGRSSFEALASRSRYPVKTFPNLLAPAAQAQSSPSGKAILFSGHS